MGGAGESSVPHSSEVERFHEVLNDYHPNLQFNLEVGNLCINSLDLIISLSQADYGLTIDIDIYRKPEYTGTYIHSLSLHLCDWLMSRRKGLY